jgi:hypothetical protein
VGPLKVADLGKSATWTRTQTRVWDAEGSHVTCAKAAISPPIPQRMIIARNFFFLIDAETSDLGDASVKNHLPLHGRFWHQIRHT